MSYSLRPHGLQHARPPCPSPTPRVYSHSCLLSWWCHPTISCSVVPFSFHHHSSPASGSFQMSQLFTSGGQSIRVSASTSVLPMNTQDWSPLGWTGWISLQSKGLSRVFSNTTVQKNQFFGAQLSLWSSSHIHTWLLEKTIALTRRTFAGKVISLLFNMLSKLVITFLPRRLSTNVQQNLPKLNGLTHQQTLDYLSWICEFTEWFFCNFFLGWGTGGEVDSHAATVKWLLSWMVPDDSLICLVCWRDDERLGLLNLHITGLDLYFGNWILNPKSQG